MMHLRSQRLLATSACCFAAVLASCSGGCRATVLRASSGEAQDGASTPHFMTGTYGLLRTSGNRVSQAVQRMLGVQGSLDNLKDDLSTEYQRWKVKQKEMLAQRDVTENKIRDYEAELLEQKSQRAQVFRLRGDLELATKATRAVNRSHEEQIPAMRKRRQALQDEVQQLVAEINSTHKERQATLVALHNETNNMRRRQLELTVKIMASNTSIADLEEQRAKHSVVASRSLTGLLSEVSTLKVEMEQLTSSVRAQRRLQWERGQLAERAREVVQQREEADQDDVGCENAVQRMNAELMSSATAMQEETAKLRQCQFMAAENAALQGKANKCKAAVRAGSGT